MHLTREWLAWFDAAWRATRRYSGYAAPLIFSGLDCRGAILRFPPVRAANDP